MSDAFDVEAYLEEQISKTKEQKSEKAPSNLEGDKKDDKRDDRDRDRNRDSRRDRDRSPRDRRRDSRSRSRDRRRRRDSRSRSRDRRDSRRDRDRGSDARSSRDERDSRDSRTEKVEKKVLTEAEKEAERQQRREKSAERRREREAQEKLMRKSREIEDLTKDQRTIFVSQLTKKANERDLENFFGQIGKVNNIIMLRDKVSGFHKGFAYVEMADLDTIPNCLLFNNVVPDFQKFPILVKASEAEKNFLAKKDTTYSTYDSGADSGLTSTLLGGPETRIYIGNIHVSIDESGLKSVVEQFGTTESIKLHRDNLGNSKGFAFVKYLRAESAALAMSALGGLELAGRALKVGPVIDSKTTTSSSGGGGGSGMQMQDSFGNWRLDTDDSEGNGFQLNSSSRAQLMAKLGQSAGISVPMPAIPAGLMLNSFGQVAVPQQYVPPPAPVIPPVGGVPSVCLLICNMFDAATETEPEWDLDIKEDVMEECGKHGQVEHCLIEKNKPGGMVFVKLRSVDAATKTAHSLNGRFFAGRMVTVTFLEPAQYAQLAY